MTVLVDLVAGCHGEGGGNGGRRTRFEGCACAIQLHVRLQQRRAQLTVAQLETQRHFWRRRRLKYDVITLFHV